MKKRITKQARIGIKKYEFLRQYSIEYGITISKAMDLAVDYFSGEHKREEKAFEVEFGALFPNRYTNSDKQKVSKGAENTVLSILSTINKKTRTDGNEIKL